MLRRSKAQAAPNRQPDLFAFERVPRVAPSADPSTWSRPDRLAGHTDAGPKPSVASVTASRSIGRTPTSAILARDIRIIALDDLPVYAPLDQELVDRSIAALPPGRMWFTYAAIKECFGVSRATVARKVKQGLVPGIRFCGTSVLEDGPVRRFDRGQLRWLLLAVRARP